MLSSPVWNCAERLRELGFPDTAVFTTAKAAIGLGKTGITVTQGAAIGTLTEADVAVIYPATFTPARGATHEFMDQVRLLREWFQEQTQKAA